MARVITLDGLKTAKLGRRYRQCRRREVYYSPTLDEEVEVCVGRKPKRVRRRKPVTTTTKRKRKLTASSCTKTKRVRNKKTGKMMCMCIQPHGQILPSDACKVSRKGKKR